MNFLDFLCTHLGINMAGVDTDDKKVAAITTAINSMRLEAATGAALMAKLGAKSQDEAMATLATMVSREYLTEVEGKMTGLDKQLVLLEGQAVGKLSASDCEKDKGWAYMAAQQSPAVLRTMLPNLPVKVATGSAIQAVVAGLQTVSGEAVASGTAAKHLTVKGVEYALTDLTSAYSEADMANLKDQCERVGADAMVKQGYLAQK